MFDITINNITLETNLYKQMKKRKTKIWRDIVFSTILGIVEDM